MDFAGVHSLSSPRLESLFSGQLLAIAPGGLDEAGA